MAESHPRQEVASGIDTAYLKELSFDSLWHLHTVEKLTQTEIADIFNVSRSKVRNKLVSWGIFRDSELQYSRERIKDLYHDKGLSIKDTAARLSIGSATVSRHIRYYGLNKTHRQSMRDRDGYFNVGCSFRTNTRGYEVWSTPNGSYHVHRLVAVAEYGIEAVKSDQVHHVNGIKWDNRPSNLEVLSADEHSQEHAPHKPLSEKLSEESDDTVSRALRRAGYDEAAKEI